jgi:CRP-like cAMP-binding protein
MAGALRGVPIFEGVPEAALAVLEAAAERRELRGGETVFERDAACDGLYLVWRGKVVIRLAVVGQPIERIREVGAGDVFGEIEVLDGSRRQFQARALGSTVLLRLPQDPLWTFLRQHPAAETRLRTLAIYRRTSRLHALLAPATRRDPRIRVDREVSVIEAGPGAGTAAAVTARAGAVTARAGAGAATAGGAAAAGAGVTARLEDLSHGGACLSGAPRGWRPGDTVRFTLGYGGHRELLEIEAKVRWRMHDLVGLVFEPGAGGRAPQALERQVDRALRVLLAPTGVPNVTDS